MNLLPDRNHIDKSREKINERLMDMLEKDKEIRLVQTIASYHVDIDIYLETLEDITIKAQEELLKTQEKLKSLKKSYDMILESYSKVSNQEIKNIRWILNARRKSVRQQ